jgi:hypothetical protein
MSCKSFIQSFGILLAGLTTSQAASIVWNTPQIVAGDSDISLDGIPVAAFDIGDTGSVSINGVNFVGTQSTAWGVGFFSAYGQPSAVTGTSYGAALNTGMYQSGDGSSYQVFLGAANIGTNLTVGQTYEVQIWFNDNRFGATPETMRFSANNTAPFVTLTSTATTSQYVIGTFTADAAPQNLYWTETGSNFDGATINMFQIRAVPEPSAATALLGGFGLLGLIRRRR